MSSPSAAEHSISLNAYALHEAVPPDRWCVTLHDLLFLQKDLGRAIQRQEIWPPHDGHDDWTLTMDQGYGPSIYTVNEQYIKPITEKAGKMSWALMRNPEGLECDLFISHAWQEGVFEFLAKVRHSWPRGAVHAWCCMLANPQNLNLASFLTSPSTSPFAVALKASEIVLVVPNRHQSVYTRLWCAYEAYLAHEEGKRILIAKPSNLPQILSSMRLMLLASFLGAFLGLLGSLYNLHYSKPTTFLGCLLCVLSLNIQHDTARITLHFFLMMLCWTQISHYEPLFPTWSTTWDFQPPVHVAFYTFFYLMSAIFCSLMEVDRISGNSTVVESEQLQKNYKGSIRHAECSEPADAVKIRAEIGGKREEVDYAIHVLLTAGMSTTALREVARSGVDIEYAAYSEISCPVIILGPYELVTLAFLVLELIHYRGVNYLLWALLAGLSLVVRLLLIGVILRRADDERCFILKVLTKAVAVVLVIFAVVCSLSSILSMQTLSMAWLVLSAASWSVVLAFALLGIQGTAKLPLGLSLLQIFFARGRKVFGACARSSFAPALPHSDASSDSESEASQSGSS
ncbi:Uncharacterized protein SCF082_LOCUS15040 [Durusdinium trenchii]|uniref:Uncharacterized protein n=1 Tax=Durusdinium trenchii TaxID=1381693 RepID=A0ABP0K1W3_9DINO